MSGSSPGGGLTTPIELPAEVLEIARRLEEAGYSTWCVGGALRDRLLGIPNTDFDLATAATPEEVQRLFPHTVPVGTAFGTVGVLDRERVMHEVTTFRKDVRTDGRHAVVEFGASLEDDLARRDFTINAIAYHPLERTWRDPFGGSDDLLRHRIVRAVGQPAGRFAEDYLRILRMVRFAARLGFAIDPETWRAAVAAAVGLGGLSAERVRDEWFKGLRTAQDLREFVRLWREVGAAGIWMPELASDYPLAEASPAARDPVVLTAALCREAADVLRRLRASNEEIARARALGTGPTAPRDAGAVAVRRWMADVGDAAGDLIRLAALREGAAPAWSAEVGAVRQRGEATTRGQLAVTGDDLIAAGFPAGPGLGALLTRLLDVVLEDPALNEREALLAAARSWR